MKNRILLVIVAVLIIVGSMVGVYYYSTLPVPSASPSPSPTSPSPTPTPEKYLCFAKGGKTRVFLIDSNIKYDNYSTDIYGVWSGWARKGDPCVIIYGTIRNDYPKDYFISLTANIYNATGEKVGHIIYSGGPFMGANFVVVHAESGGTATFEIPIKYDERDIIRYDVFLAFEPTEYPPP